MSRFRVQESRRIPSANIFALVIEHTVIVCHYENEIQLVVEEIKDCEGITEPVYFVDTQSVNPPPTTAEANAPEDYENNDAAEDLTDKSDSETDVISKPITDKGQTLTSGITHDTTDRLVSFAVKAVWNSRRRMKFHGRVRARSN